MTSHYNFEVQFTNEVLMDAFHCENTHVTSRMKLFRKLGKLNYLVSFKSRRTEKSVTDIFSKYCTKTEVSTVDLRIKTGNYVKEKKPSTILTGTETFEKRIAQTEESKQQHGEEVSVKVQEDVVKIEES